MLEEELLKTIECLKEDYKPLYDSLCVLDKCLSEEEAKKGIHFFLRERLLVEMKGVPAGTPKAKVIHQALRALTRKHPFNKECPIELDDIDFDDVDSYLALSTGHVVLRTPHLNQNLKKSHKSWSNPLTGLEYSPYDVDYIETLLGFKKPEPIKMAVLTPFGAAVITLDNRVMLVTESGLVAYPERLLYTFPMMVALNVFPTFETLYDLRVYEREVQILNAAQRQEAQSSATARHQDQEEPQVPVSTEPPQSAAQHGTRRSFFSRFRGHIEPNVNVDGTQRRRPCVIL